MVKLAAIAVLLSLGQAELPTTEKVGTARAERLAQDVKQLESAVEQEADSALPKLIMELANKYFEANGGGKFLPSTVGSLKTRELKFCREWNSPSEERKGVIPALDFESPNHLPALLKNYSELFKDMGIELLVVPVPLRVQVYPDHLVGIPEQENFTGYGAGVTPTLLHLARSGVEVLDLLSPFATNRYTEAEQTDERLYLDYDIHWTPRGCRLAADEIAERIQSCDWFEPGPEREGEEFFVRRVSGKWTVPMNQGLRNPLARQPADVWYDRVTNKEGKPCSIKDADSPILLMGDSFVNLYEEKAASIAHQLYARLGRRIDVIGLPGGGSALWKVLRRRGKERMEGKRLIIWLTSNYELMRPCTPKPLFRE